MRSRRTAATSLVAFSPAGIASNVDTAVQQSLEVIRQRVDQVGVAEPTIQRIGANRVLVQLPGAQDPSRLRQLLGSTAKMSFHMLSPNNAPGPGVTMLKDEKGNTYPVLDRVEISGDRLSDARVSFDPNTHEPVVSFRFDSAGATRFADITRQNVGNPFAIVLDDKVLSAPVIREPITGGSGQISGSFSADSATTLAAMLRAGALPAKLTVIEERTVGADLGADAINKGIYSGIVGFVLVAAFIFILYGTWGFLANFALLIHTILTVLGADACRSNADAARHRRRRPRHRPCGRRQRSHQRAHPRRNTQGQERLCRDRHRLPPRLFDDHRRQHDGADRRRDPVLVRLRTSPRLCRDHGAWPDHLDVHVRCLRSRDDDRDHPPP